LRVREGLGALYLGEGRCLFRVWAPRAEAVELHLLERPGRLVPLGPAPDGYHEAVVSDVRPGARYRFRLDGKDELPDPASRFQPEGVHGPSQVVDPDFDWTDGEYRRPTLRDYAIYEIHVGAFTSEGTFDAIVPRLPELRELGVTAVELMPLGQFPGERNWGYDGVFPFAVQASYGGPEGLKRLVNACHASGMAVILDVIENHLGPEGNVLDRYGPYFTDRYRTPWGEAPNFDGPDSDEVRRYFIENALYWVDEFHVDALRLDAVHAIIDVSPRPFLEELAATVRERASRPAFLVPESADNDARLVRSRELSGFGFDALWNDDFHHALRTLITGERKGYYRDYGELRQLAKASREGFVYTGEYSPFRRRRHGTPSSDLSPERFVVFSQNHDQVGNRMLGERLTALVDFERLKLAAAAVILSPYLPLLFMGEEYGESAPFPYFVSHGDPELIESVRSGRKEEFASFDWGGEPPDWGGEPPDPQAEATFLSAKLDWKLRGKEPHRSLLDLYRELLRLRREEPALRERRRIDATADERARVVTWSFLSREQEALVVLHFSSEGGSIPVVPRPAGWRREIDTAEARFGGPKSASPAQILFGGELQLAPWSAVLLLSDTGSARS
jgi:maltooligosyltrehalose trehalohydrolase